MTDLGEISHYFSMKVDVEIGKKISLRRTTCRRKILKRFQMSDCKLVSIFMNPVVATSLLPSESQPNKVTIKWYQSAIGLLTYPTVPTWLDSCYSMGVFSYYGTNSGSIYCNLVIQIFQYLAWTLDLRITFESDITDKLWIHWFRVGGTLRRLTINRWIFIYLFRWTSVSLIQHQTTVALSSTEAEYMAIMEAGKKT